jgi:hypothetical protein
MKNSSFKSSVFGAIFAATGMVSTLVADPLLPGGAVEAAYDGTFSLSGATYQVAALSSFQSGPITGQVGVSVWNNVATNPFGLGSLTFVYEVATLTSNGTQGLTGFGIAGWAGVSTNVATGGDFYFTPSSTPVEEGWTTRSGDGNSIWFDFPPGSSEPPIFVGENSYQLIVYTNATAWTWGFGTADGWDFDEFGAIVDGTYWADSDSSMKTLVAVSPVPDNGSTALLLGMGFMAMGLSLARSRKVAVRK